MISIKPIKWLPIHKPKIRIISFSFHFIESKPLWNKISIMRPRHKPLRLWEKRSSILVNSFWNNWRKLTKEEAGSILKISLAVLMSIKDNLDSCNAWLMIIHKATNKWKLKKCNVKLNRKRRFKYSLTPKRKDKVVQRIPTSPNKINFKCSLAKWS